MATHSKVLFGGLALALSGGAYFVDHLSTRIEEHAKETKKQFEETNKRIGEVLDFLKKNSRSY